ncbi:hypothetical protein L596_030943 [Steinernema carpocapsae]|uniref:SH3 domain-containing protein n=1 Tax=Steinernema carpocapsae TaxID=34508 RepID=A0A4U5MHD8_STECR|nr:hypothetical protein L596_030943 [Steinernema carpocapsae]
MFDKSLLPPPLPPKSRNESLGAQLPTYRERPKPHASPSSGGGFAAAKSLFENQTVRNMAFSAAQNPAVRNATISAAQNPAVRNAALSAVQNPSVRNVAISSMVQQQCQKPPLVPKPQKFTTLQQQPVNDEIQKKKVANLVKELDNFYSHQPTPPRPNGAHASLYPALPEESSFQSPFIPTPIRTTSIPTSQTFDNSLICSVRSSSVQPDYLSSSYSAQQELDDLFGTCAPASCFAKKPAPARPPPPKFKNSQSHPNLNQMGGSSSPNIFEPHAIVKYPYKAAHKDELTCQPNDVVLLQREVDEQWVYALNTRSGQRGIVPLVFLTVKVPLVPESKNSWGDNSVGSMATSFEGLSFGGGYKTAKTARAIYDYSSPVQGDLQFKAGDIITILDRVDADWYKGTLFGRTGIFPSNFVETGTPTSNATTPLASPKSAFNLGTVTATYDYASGVSEDLTFQAGDVIEVVERINDEWIRGRLGPRVGMVPLTFVTENN